MRREDSENREIKASLPRQEKINDVHVKLCEVID